MKPDPAFSMDTTHKKIYMKSNKKRAPVDEYGFLSLICCARKQVC